MKRTEKILFVFTAFIILNISLLSISGCSLLGIEIVDSKELDSLKQENTDLKAQESYLEEEIIMLEEDLAKERIDNGELDRESQEYQDTIKDLQDRIAELESTLKDYDHDYEVASLEEEIQGLMSILEDFEYLLSNVYIGTTEPFGEYSFTAFSMQYGNKTYIVTAGHCINDNRGSDRVFKFKANFSDEWIYPKLIGYNPAFWDLDDYAVFSSDRISGGLVIGEEPSERNYLLGSLDKGLNVFRYIGESSIRGESGSPVINMNGEVVGIYVVYGTEFTPIDLATEIIDISKTAQ